MNNTGPVKNEKDNIMKDIFCAAKLVTIRQQIFKFNWYEIQ